MAISDDLNSIRTHLEDDYKALETLGVSVEDRNIENIKDMAQQIYAKFPKTEYGEGSNITIENCLKGKLDFEDGKVGYGDTKQESTNGYQLFDKDNANIINGYINSSTAGDNYKKILSASTARTIYISCKSNTTYTISKISSQRFVVASSSVLPAFQVVCTNLVNGSTNTTATITTGENDIYLCVFYYLSTADTLSEEEIRNSIMIEEGSTAHSWEKYTGGIPSPNSSYPFPVKSVTGNQSVTVRGKNFVEGLELGEINAQTGAESPASNIVRTINYIPYSRLKSYRQSVNGENLSSGTNLRFYNKNKEYIGYAIFGYSTSITDVEITKGTGVTTTDLEPKYFRIRVGTSVLQTNSKYMIATSNDLTYEPYQLPITKQLSLGDKELFEDSYISKENGNWYFNDNWKRITLNGTEDWVYNGTSAIHHRLTISDANFTTTNMQKTNVRTTRFAQGIWNNSNDNEVVTTSSASTTLGIVCNTYTSKDAFSTFLSNNNTDLVYPLAETIKTPITDTNLINQLEDLYNMQSVNGTTIIEINGNLPMIIKCRALKNG